jgi:hypothetical protein
VASSRPIPLVARRINKFIAILWLFSQCPFPSDRLLG